MKKFLIALNLVIWSFVGYQVTAFAEPETKKACVMQKDQKTGKEKDSTKTIWFYEHPYPEGYKSYSKTRPMQFSEFIPEQEWWQDLYDTSTYENRTENEHTWKIDFLKEKNEALAKAEPHYKQASEYEREKQEKSEKIKKTSR